MSKMINDEFYGDWDIQGKAVESFIIDSLEKWGCTIMARNALFGGTLTSGPLPLVLYKVLFQLIKNFFQLPWMVRWRWEELLPGSIVPRSREEAASLLLWHASTSQAKFSYTALEIWTSQPFWKANPEKSSKIARIRALWAPVSLIQ